MWVFWCGGLRGCWKCIFSGSCGIPVIHVTSQLWCTWHGVYDDLDWGIYGMIYRCKMHTWHFAEYRLFYRALLQKRPIILSDIQMWNVHMIHITWKLNENRYGNSIGHMGCNIVSFIGLFCKRDLQFNLIYRCEMYMWYTSHGNWMRIDMEIQ